MGGRALRYLSRAEPRHGLAAGGLGRTNGTPPLGDGPCPRHAWSGPLRGDGRHLAAFLDGQRARRVADADPAGCVRRGGGLRRILAGVTVASPEVSGSGCPAPARLVVVPRRDRPRCWLDVAAHLFVDGP